MNARESDYARELARLAREGRDYSWERTGAGGHVLDVYPDGLGPATHTHYRRDGSAYRPTWCGCFTR